MMDNHIFMKAGKFQDISREIVGENRQFLLQLERVADRQRVESILLEYKAAVKQARGAMLKTLIKRAKREAFTNLSTVIAIHANIDSDAGLVALFQESIDINTEAGRAEWSLLESHTQSNQAAKTLIAKLSAWLKKLNIFDPQASHWVDAWKLYAGRKLIPVAQSALANVLDAKRIESRINTADDLTPETIRDFLLALCTGPDAQTQRDYITAQTDSPQKLVEFKKMVLELAQSCTLAPAADDGSEVVPATATELLRGAAQIIFFRLTNPSRLSPVPSEPRFGGLAMSLPTSVENPNDDAIRLVRGGDGKLSPLDADPEKSGPVSLGKLAKITRHAAVGDFEPLDASAGEISVVRERGFNDGLQAATVEKSGVMVRDSVVLNVADSLTESSESGAVADVIVPAPVPSTFRADTPVNRGLVRSRPSRQGLGASVTSFTGPMFAVAASMLIAAGLTGRSKEIDPNHSDMITDVRSSIHTLRSTAPVLSSAVNERDLCTDQVISAQQDTVRSVVSTTTPVFYTGDVLPQGPNTCIMGGAKHVLRSQFNIVDEMRLERLSNQAENAIRVARTAGMHTNPGDQVALAYDETRQTWFVRQIRDGQIIVSSSFVSSDGNNMTTANESYFEPNFLNKLWTKGKSLWQSFKGLWA